MANALAAGLEELKVFLPEATLKNEIIFLDELLRWNRQINLTAVRDRQGALEKHLIDSLALLAYLPGAAQMLDIGSGAGLPGIPLAVARPELQVVSIDSVGKKISFQKHIKRLMKLGNLHPVHGRIEALDMALADHAQFDLAVARAFSSLEQLLKKATPWLQPEGELLAMKGPEGEDELRRLEPRLSVSGFQLKAVESYRLPFSQAERLLIRLKRTPLD